jgi:16S rRNA (uracil1498-N3)-methyltransferase
VAGPTAARPGAAGEGRPGVGSTGPPAVRPPAEGPRAPSDVVVYVLDVERAVVDPATRHHLSRVRRLRPGTAVTLADGRGAFRPGTVVDAGEVVVPTGPPEWVAAPTPPVVVAVPALPGDRAALAVRQATEAGADLLVLYQAARSVARWSADEDAVRERLERVARAAGAQARRLWLPSLRGPTTISRLWDDGLPVVRAAPDAGRLPAAGEVVVVGPEGGFAPEEVARVADEVGLGPYVLRAETAVAVAAALAAAMRSTGRAGVVVTEGDQSVAGRRTLREDERRG